MSNLKIKDSRKLATIREVKEIRPITGADKIQVAVVDGWECVVKLNEFKAGDKVIYIEIDSIMPERPEFEFLRERNFRIRTIKLRKQISQGLVLPLTYLPKRIRKYKLGEDVTKLLCIKKYDPEKAEESKVVMPGPKNKIDKFLMKFNWYNKYIRKYFVKPTKKHFPSWIFKTDETRVQNMPSQYDKLRQIGSNFFITEKLDGQSFTAYIDSKDNIGICSRNLELSTTEPSNYQRVFETYNLRHILTTLKKENNANTIVLQGEICGPGIQGNKYNFTEPKLFIFNYIVDGKARNYYSMDKDLLPYNLQLVPLIDSEVKLPETIAEVVELSKGNSRLVPHQVREGVVIRDYSYKESFKVINPEFLLKEK